MESKLCIYFLLMKLTLTTKAKARESSFIFTCLTFDGRDNEQCSSITIFSNKLRNDDKHLFFLPRRNTRLETNHFHSLFSVAPGCFLYALFE